MRNNSLVIVVDEVLRKISKGEERERGGEKERRSKELLFNRSLCL
jgi:hypothetical protein